MTDTTALQALADKVEAGALHYTIRQQDGSLQPMACPDTPTNRMFVAWVMRQEGFYRALIAGGRDGQT